MGLPIPKDEMLFTLHYTLSYSVNQVRLMENVFTYNLAKSTPYLHRVTFCKGPLCEGVHKSVLSVDTADEEHCEWGWIELIALSSISKTICQSENIKDVESILV